MSNAKACWAIMWGLPLFTRLTRLFIKDKDRIKTLIEALRSMARKSGTVDFSVDQFEYVNVFIKHENAVIYMRMKAWIISESANKDRDALINYVIGKEDELSEQVIGNIYSLEVVDAIIAIAINIEKGAGEDEYEQINKLIELLGLRPELAKYSTTCHGGD